MRSQIETFSERKFEDQYRTKISAFSNFGNPEIFLVFRYGFVFPNFIEIEIAILNLDPIYI